MSDLLSYSDIILLTGKKNDEEEILFPNSFENKFPSFLFLSAGIILGSILFNNI